MNVLIVGLVYGNRPNDILYDNLKRTGYPATYTEVDREGIANALNDGLDLMMANGFDAVAFLANDITEPDNWLMDKVKALQEYPGAGVVASTIHEPAYEIFRQLIIGNWLVSKKTVETVGYFNESMFPYGPIDLDYCERCNINDIGCYYVKNCHATHKGDHATGNEYGWNKGELVAKYERDLIQNVRGYASGTLSTKMERL